MRNLRGIVFLGWLLCVAASYAQSVVVIELPEDYGKKWATRIDGNSVSGSQVLEELIKAKESKAGSEVGAVVMLPRTVTLAGWSNIQGIVDKVSFSSSRYFLLSDD